MFNFAGMTLGGIFCVDYVETPIGPYKEVAFLSGLVGRQSGIGAWASHIVVDSEDAAYYGERFWGLPAEVLPIDFVEESGSLESNEADVMDIFMGEDGIQVFGWNAATTITTCSEKSTKSTASIFSWLDISLPSFSGRLKLQKDPSPLLRYPLRIQSPHSITLTKNNGRVQFEGSGSIQTELRELFAKSIPLVSVRIEDVKLTAGIATVECD